MEGQTRGIVLVLLLSFLSTQVFGQLSPLEPRVMCPAGHPKSWTYNRPGSWGDMCRQYSTCNSGARQSPVNLPVNRPVMTSFQLPPLNLGFSPVNLIRVGDLLTMPIYTTSSFPFGGRLNYLSHIEFHSPSEHTIGGVSFDLEVQLYFNWSPSHRFGSPRTVISLMFNRDTCDHEFFSALNPAIPRRSRCECGNNRTENTLIFSEECDQGSDFNAMLPGRCRPNCVKPFCGDGVKDPTEECDTKGNSSTCVSCKIPRCGDGVKNAGEECDDGNRLEQDGCSGLCKLECGDGCLQGKEVCDLGPLNSVRPGVDTSTNTVCRPDCQWARCGDGIVDIGEACDAGDAGNNASLPDGCRPGCRAPRCGDGIIDPRRNETCDGGALCDNALCTLLCGNGRVDGAEQCDAGVDNSIRPGAPCRPGCRTAGCGDGIVDPGEQCDPLGNPLCNSTCGWRCGNRIIEAAANETCDNGHSSIRPEDGNSNTRPNACRENCLLPSCGDNVIDPVNCEQCDNGTRNADAPNACRKNCTLPICGDRIIDAGEECDDGDNIDDNGCSCCRNDCGNGIKQGNEQCDDGAANSDTIPNRCRKNCLVHYCGDGLTDFDEECDPRSGKTVGCTADCRRPFCGDGVLAPGLGEECDNGALNSYAAINGCSPICTLNFCGQVLTNTHVNLATLTQGLTEADGSLKTITYVGSETHPPCSEGVLWHIVPRVGKISNAQFMHFSNAIYKNNRPVQSFAGRSIIDPTVVAPIVLDPRAVRNCGNGIVERGEECDNGALNSNVVPNACRLNCVANRCGDGVVDDGEDCDDSTPSCASCKAVRRSQLVRAPQSTCWSHPSQGIWDTCGPHTCTGNLQSPIRLPANICPKSRALNLNHPSNAQYNPTPVVLINDGNRIILPTVAGGSFNYHGVSYALRHIEFRAPSEHYIGSKQFDFEVQLHHQSQNPAVDRRAVVVVLFNVGSAANAFLAPIFDRLPRASHCQCGNGIREDVMMTPNGRIIKEECDDGPQNSNSLPDRCRTNCRLPYCGDGVTDACNKEACDNGILNGDLPNRCRSTCRQPYCGDGIVDNMFDEECDDGNNRNGDGCSALCRRECGNGVIDSPLEQCDNGVSNSDVRADACRTNCKHPVCGDNVLDYAEECDNGPLNSNRVSNACRANCTKPVCGDGVVDPLLGEECDGGLDCDGNCRKLCGNGVLNDGEICDTGSMLSSTFPNACRKDCTPARCGDGVVDSGEECDDGALNTVRCQSCKIRCGNGILETGEECDDGSCNSDTTVGACRTSCRKSFCGDGVQDANEECDNGALNANTANACRPLTCKVPRCGDLIRDSGETCDDGNTIDGDGCSSCCQLECGNGKIDSEREQCDAGVGNANTASCCRPNCLLPFCGDGITDNGEECDDGTNNGNSPNSCRSNCRFPNCGDGIVDHLFGEICDHGSRNGLLAVDGCAPNCIPNSCRQSVAYNVTVNPQAVLPTTPGTYMYPGSTNTPPCSENVDYFVFSTPQTLSAHQYNQYSKTNLVGARRCLQPTNGRPINFLEAKSVCGDGITEGNEECDNGPQNSDTAADACRRNCRKSFCGDGVLDKGEVCDGTPNCSPTCQLSCPTANGTGTGAGAGAGAGTCSGTNTGTNAGGISNTENGSTINVDFASILAQ